MWSLIEDGEGWGVKHVDGVIENPEPMSCDAAVQFKAWLEQAWIDEKMRELRFAPAMREIA